MRSLITLQSLSRSFRNWRRISLYSLALFTRQLSTLLTAGVSLARSLDALKTTLLNGLIGSGLNRSLQGLEGGLFVFSLPGCLGQRVSSYLH